MRSLYKHSLIIFLLFANAFCYAQQPQTYCNPLNLDYTYMIYNANDGISYRSGADPAVVRFKGEYYLFVTRSMGYWHSTDLTNWNFITPEKWYFQGSNAPASHNYKDSVLYVMGDPSGTMSVLYTDNPKKGDWKATPALLFDLQDPALFIDDDDKAYVYWGSSNVFPIRAKKLDKNKNFKPSIQTDTLFGLNALQHGWERFGEDNEGEISGYIEGAWMTKYKDSYYLQYAAPGTEFNVYGDGAYTSKSPLGPFTYMANNPFSFKPGGFINGAGHGSTVDDIQGKYWHFSTMAVSVNVNWERRISLFPTYFDADGLLYSDSYFGDYPYYAPNAKEKAGEFTGWMLLSYNKKVKTSSAVAAYIGNLLTDENIKTFWLAENTDASQWVEIDLEKVSSIYALQINFHDYQSNLYGRIPNLMHQYVIKGSLNGKDWFMLVDKSANTKDVPNDYVQLEQAKEARYIRYEHLKVPTPHLAISDIRIFGRGNGKVPKAVKKFTVKRQADERNADITWEHDPKANGYNILWGIAPDKLYSSWLIYGKDKLDLRSLTKGQSYYFAIESFNENGISTRSEILKID
ncbi:family 43 glycosylhydrolase [Sphingobacterium hungaricum]